MNGPIDGPGQERRTDALELNGRTVLVLGLGESGNAMVRYLVGEGATVCVVDTRDDPPGLELLKERFVEIECRQQPLAAVALDGVDMIAWSPGLSNELGDGKLIFDQAVDKGVPVLSELDLFADALSTDNHRRQHENRKAAKVVAVTGTNGKTTVTELAGLLSQAAGVRVVVAGNIGPPMLEAWCDARQRDQMPDLWVIELSSFQLALTRSFSPDVGAILNISQDHLDWHRDFESYASAKQRVIGRKSIAIGLRGDKCTMAAQCQHQRTIGLDEPSRAGDMGIVHEGGIAWLAWAVPAELPIPGKRVAPDTGILIKRLMPADALRIRGAHNHLNTLAALSLCEAVGISMAGMLHALRDYEGRAHRCELVGLIDDVEYYNDSKGTNVGATVAALNGLGKPSWLIAGGIGKDQDFSDLAKAVKMNAAGVLLIGRDASLIRHALADCPVPVHDCESMAEAVHQARRLAGTGQAVLLSPACSSFDMFDNYQHRGAVFRDLVQELAMSRESGLEVPCSR